MKQHSAILAGVLVSLLATAVNVVAQDSAAQLERVSSMTPSVIVESPSGADLAYIFHDGRIAAGFDASAIRLSLGRRGSAERWGLIWSPVDARTVAPRPEAKGSTKMGYFLGQDPSRWKTSLPTWSRVAYDAVLPGVDIAVEPRAHGIKYSVLAAAGAGSTFRFRYDGAEELRIADDGASLEIVTGDGVLREHGLTCWQPYGSAGRLPVVARYIDVRREGDLTWSYSIAVDVVDASLPMVIDPELSWGTYIGGRGVGASAGLEDWGRVAVDAQGMVFMAGEAAASPYFPTTGGPIDHGANEEVDDFLTKYDASGQRLWAIFIGGSGSDEMPELALDSQANPVLLGYTESDDFPTTPGSFQPLRTAGSITFVAKISSSGDRFIWSTFYGSDRADGNPSVGAYTLAVGQDDSVYIGGGVLPTPWHEAEASLPGMDKGFNSTLTTLGHFLAKIAADGTSVAWSGMADGMSGPMTVDSGGNVYFGFSPVEKRTRFAKLKSDGKTILWQTDLDSVESTVIALDASGNLLVTGAATGTFQPTPGVFAPTVRPAHLLGGVLLKLKADGSGVVWASYLDGYMGVGVACDPNGDIIVANHASIFDVDGTMRSTATDLDTRAGFQPLYGPPIDPEVATWEGANPLDIMVTKVSPDGRSVLWSSYYGGSNYDIVEGLAVNATGIYLAGFTLSENLPVPHGYDTTLAPGFTAWDCFLAKVTEWVRAAPGALTFTGLNPAPQTVQLTAMAGATGATWTLADDAAWLSVTPTSGTSEVATTLTATVSTAGLDPNLSYSASITLTASGGRKLVIPVMLSMIPQNPAIVVPPAVPNGGGKKCGSSASGSSRLGMLAIVAMICFGRTVMKNGVRLGIPLGALLLCAATPVVIDTKAPVKINDLKIVMPPNTQDAVLSWGVPSDTAPGPDGTMEPDHVPQGYDLRYSDVGPITDGDATQATDWTKAVQVAGEPSPAGKAVGDPQSMTVTVPKLGTTYWFAIKSNDAAGNISKLSNVIYGPFDTTSPSAIVLNASIAAHSLEVTLTWNAPDDPDDPVEAYDLRYAASPITDLTWNGATPVAGEPATPNAGGAGESMTLTVPLGAMRYYFAIKSCDTAANWSPLSNSPYVDAADVTAPDTIFLTATASAASQSVTLTWTAPGDPDDATIAYDFRYLAGDISDANWSSATPVVETPATPQLPGSLEVLVMPLPAAGVRYTFAIKSRDASGNWSFMSNAVAAEINTVIDTPGGGGGGGGCRARGQASWGAELLLGLIVIAARLSRRNG